MEDHHTPIALAATHHDPHGRLNAQAVRVLPRLREWYTHLAVVVTAATPSASRETLRAAGVTVYEDASPPDTFRYLGRKRRRIVEAALEASSATHVHLCDFDRVLHWAEFQSADLRAALNQIGRHDFTVLGRTPRAYASHPRVQRDTEALINHAFALAFGQLWDVGAASRGLSRRAAQALIAGCDDDTIGNDCSWPLFLARHDGLRLGYLETEGLEFETPDRYAAEIASAGGLDAWIARMDASPAQWAHRLELARIEVESVVKYSSPRGQA